jgi:hypothetical protein
VPTAREQLEELVPDVVRRADALEQSLLQYSYDAVGRARQFGLLEIDDENLDRILDQAKVAGSEVHARAQLHVAGILSVGVTRRPGSGEYVPAVYVRGDEPSVRLSESPEDAPDLQRHWNFVQAMRVSPADAVLIVLPQPVAQVACGDAASCGGVPGTYGAFVTTGKKTSGILTAGHVASQGSAAYTASGSYVGVTIDSLSLANPGPPTIDIAVIEYGTGVYDTPGVRPSSLRPRAARIRDTVVGHGARTPGAAARVVAINAQFAGPTPNSAPWSDAIILSGTISTNGDSGGMVLDAGTGELVGHIVGGFQGAFSILQDATAQLQAVKAALR